MLNTVGHSSLQVLAVRLDQFIGALQELQFMLVANSPLLFKKLMAGTVLLAYIIGPKSCIDIAAATKQDSFSANLTFAHMRCIALQNKPNFAAVFALLAIFVRNLQVLAIEFVLLAIDFVPLANEFVLLANEFVPLAIEFVPLAIEFVLLEIEFVLNSSLWQEISSF